MWMLGQKDGKPWWHKRDDRDNWIPVTEEENATNKQYWNDKRDSIAAKIFNDAFNKGEDAAE
jgi:hypothetical protein